MNTQLFGSLTALCEDESRESRRDWWALWVDRALLSSQHRSFRQGFLHTLQPSETKAAMIIHTGCLGLVSLTARLLQCWPALLAAFAVCQIYFYANRYSMDRHTAVKCCGWRHASGVRNSGKGDLLLCLWVGTFCNGCYFIVFLYCTSTEVILFMTVVKIHNVLCRNTPK